MEQRRRRITSPWRWKAALGTPLVILIVVAGLLGLPSTSVAADPAPLTPENQAVLVRAQQAQLPSVQAGQVLHVIVQSYERHAPEPVGGPPHLARAVLAPETILTEYWAVAGNQGHITRVVSSKRDTSGRLLQQTAVDGAFHLVSYDAVANETSNAQFAESSRVADVSGRSGLMRDLPALAKTPPGAQGETSRAGRAAVVIEYRANPDPRWLEQNATGQAVGPYAADLAVRAFGRRLVLDRASGALLEDVHFVLTDSGSEQILSEKMWQRVEVLDLVQVPVGILTPALPTTPDRFVPVPRALLSASAAAAAVPFAFYAMPSVPGGLPTPTISYGTGQRLDPALLPLRFRSLDFIAQRGAAVTCVYDASNRYLDLVQGSSADFLAALGGAPAFWVGAEPVTMTIGGTAVLGWYLTSAPVTVTDNPQTGPFRQLPGRSYLLLPDVGGTGLLLTAQGYGKAELLAFAAGLQRVP